MADSDNAPYVPPNPIITIRITYGDGSTVTQETAQTLGDWQAYVAGIGASVVQLSRGAA